MFYFGGDQFLGNQKTLLKTRVVSPCRYRGKRPNSRLARLRNVLSSVFLVAFMMASLTILLNTTDSYADDTITLSIDTNNLAVNLKPLSSSGDFAKSDNMNISVSTTSSSGYTLSIASSTGSTDLTNQSDNNSTISSISSPLSESDFSSSSNTQYNNKWGYKPSQFITMNGDTPVINQNTNFRPLPGTGGEIIAKTACANGTSPCTNPTDTYTLSIGARANNQTATGQYVSDTFVITAVTNKGVVSCDSTKLCVEYNGNGLSFPETSTQLPRNVNNVNYNSTITGQTEITKYSHTPNIDDADTQSGNYAKSLETNKVITISGAQSLHVKLTYSTYYVGYDWVSFWAGNYPNYTAYSNYSSGIQNCGGGSVTNGKYGNSTWSSSTVNKVTVECDIPGDTVTFGFHSASYTGGNYGYYAVITGTGNTYSRSVSSGEYTTPDDDSALFYGWSNSQTTPGGGYPIDVEYTNETEVMTDISGEEGETKTLYAVWRQGQLITFNKDSNVTSISILDTNGETVGTITNDGQRLKLIQGDTYTIKPTYATGYSSNTISKISGEGTLSHKKFTVGLGPATIGVSSRLADLYGYVELLSKGTISYADMRDGVTIETSGVYEYDSEIFGASSDADNSKEIYYYRGILDNTMGTYGSDGDNTAWPNTVVLSSANNKSSLTTSDTCWRIVRTTGSGGVKMIYQGKWTSNGNSGSCKNTQSNANAESSVYFNRRSTSSTDKYDTMGRIIYVGYNYSSNSYYQTSTSSTSNSSLFTNGQPSNLRTQLENWYNNNLTSYTSKLETSAGWCSDRTTYDSFGKTTSNVPYKTSSANAVFGANKRLSPVNYLYSLTCPNDTGYDLLSVTNGSLGVPAAPLTADEVAVAGARYTKDTHNNIFLNSGNEYWLLSPNERYALGYILVFTMGSEGRLGNRYPDDEYGVRPSISLKPNITPVSGSGTATNPWIVNP